MKNKINLIIAIFVLLIPELLIAQETGTLIDSRDGKTYKTVKIGNQIWMAENLKFASNVPGSSVVDGSGNVFYNFKSACWSCPIGWHIPTKKEVKQLIKFVGKYPGTKLKSKQGWSEHGHKCNGTDKFGFNGLPLGYIEYFYPHKSTRLHNKYSNGYWVINDKKDEYFNLYYWRGVYIDGWENRLNYKYYSIRCIKD